MKKLKRIPTLQFVHKSIACLLAFCVINMPVWAIQNGDVINSGGVGITIDPGNATNVSNGTGNVTIDWKSIDTVAGENLNFNGSGNVLNNVIGGNITQFNGNLNASGHIIIVNQHGVVFGSTAQITAGHFTASTLIIEDFSNFLNSNHADFGLFKSGEAKGIIDVQSGATITAHNIDLIAHEISNSGHLVSDNGTILMATGDDVVIANSNDDIAVKITLDNPGAILGNGDPQYNVTNEGSIDAGDGKVVLAAGDTFAQALDRKASLAASFQSGEYSTYQNGTVIAGATEMSAANQVQTNVGSSIETGTVEIAATEVDLREALESKSDMEIFANNSVAADGDMTSGGKMSITADTQAIAFNGEATSEDDMLLDSGDYISLSQDVVSGGSLTINAPGGTVSTASLAAESDVELNTDLLLYGEGDQLVTSSNGGIEIDGYVEKWSETGGELGILAKDDVQLNGNVTNYTGGTAVISTDGKIASNGTDTLNVEISGYSDENAGFELPFSDSRTAIVLRSNDDLKFGPDAALIANGEFGENVDFRDGADLLSTDGKIIGGFPREAGEGLHIAIYAGSKAGNVEFSHLGNFRVNNYLENNNATVVLDAFQSVLFTMAGVPQLPSKAYARDYDYYNYGSYRLEVVSRVTQWLGEAIANNALPFAANPEIMEALLGNDYVMRGAGVASNSYKEAWVLEDMPDILPVAVAPLQQLELPELKGCPAEMDAAAAELAVNTDQMQLMIASSMASNPNIQPCEACSSLLTAAAALKDIDGMRMAALAEVFNTLAPADAPFTPEVQASISTAFAELSADNPQYAMAMEYADAFANYVAVLDNDLKLPVGDPVALVMEKYGEAIANADNPNIAIYINGQIEATGGSL